MTIARNSWRSTTIPKREMIIGVHAVVEILEQLPQHDRDGEQDQIPYDAALREIYIAFF